MGVEIVVRRVVAALRPEGDFDIVPSLPSRPRISWSGWQLCYAKILSGSDFVSFSSDCDKGLSKRQSACETQSRCSRGHSGLGLRFLSLLMLLTTVFGF